MNKLTLDFNIRLTPTNKGYVQMMELEDFSDIEPTVWVKEIFIQQERIRQNTFSKNNNLITEKEEEEWEKYFKELIQTTIPPAFIKLFDCKKRKEQESVLKNEKICSDQLTNLLCFAGMRFGYKMSKYSAFHYPNIHQDKIWPKVFHINENGVVEKGGETNLNDEQLKQIIAQRKMVFARMLELNDIWHCFYYNDKSISGKENYGKSHIHYISNYWTIPKETIVRELGNRNYNFNGIHIEYCSHRSSGK